ncbi:MAG: ATP-dependent RecD-like DNA helicase [Desulfobacterales bacterium]|nr:ATP-dependent RecD-like DNA helicase [Desulfobacterales bacterium]MDD4392058.1 ATP-dependent RecD-like DNA helicase [Desulfobacterales bacterium]
MLIDLSGQIERITYANEENGYTIARLKVYGRPDLVTVVGNIMEPAPGAVLNMKGEWTQHPRFGEQFRVVNYETAVPATVYGIKKYLGSGLIKGLGPKMAARIVKAFGEDTFDIIEHHIERLAEVDGIGKKRIEMIRGAWQAQKEIREVMVFLQRHGVSSGYATKIFKEYGNDAIAVVSENPYRLATDIFGIGFVTADKIASSLGFDKQSRFRAEAGIIYVLHRLADEGHVYYPYEPLIEKCRELLQVDREVIADALAAICAAQKIVIEDLNESIEAFKENYKAVYLAKYHLCETRITSRLRMLMSAPKAGPALDADRAIQWVQEHLAIKLAEKQVEAVKSAIGTKVLVITGGPGTGKTTIINSVLKIFSGNHATVLMAAPTGRAAKRMTETTGHEAKTIHRLLEYSFKKGGFQKNDDSPLDCDLLIVDEASMIDTILMHHLLKAVPVQATVILVGDVNQLPSVGAGNVLNDIIGSGVVPVVELNEIFRQAKNSRIIVNAHKINSGIVPDMDSSGPKTDFYFIRQEDPEKVLDIILRLVRDRIPARYGHDPVDDIQVLTPMHKGIVGAGNLNETLQQALNPGTGGIVRAGRTYRVTDKVMQIKNNYDKEVFNGDIGRIRKILAEDQDVIISFDGRDVVYDYSELDEVVLAYAVSVHKSQGSEYPVVVIPVMMQHYILLQRNLIYTAVTRAKQLVVMVGSRKALAMAVHNDKTQKRFTRLDQRLRQYTLPL